MKIELQRRLDEIVGPILCFLFWPFAPKHNGKINHSNFNPKKILIIKFLGLGSILLICPLLKKIKKTYPKAKIFFLTFKSNYQICKLVPEIDEIITMEAKSLLTFPTEMFLILKRLRHLKFDLLIDLEFFASFSTLISFFTNSKYSIGFESFKFWRQRFYSNSVIFDHGKHAIENFSRTLEVIVPEKNNDKKILLKLSDVDVQKAKNILRQNSIGQKDKYITVYPSAGPLCENRRWPIKNFAGLLKLILTWQKNLKVIFIGSKSEISISEDLISQLNKFSKRVVNLTGQTSIPEVCSIIKTSSLFIGSDSGPLHMAEAVETPTVSFFGPETPSLYGPMDSKHTVFYSDLPCSPCLNVYNSKRFICHDNRCLKTIKPESVFKVIKEKYL